MDGTKRNNIKLLGTLVNADESGIICSSDQVYDNKTKKSVADSMTDILTQVDSVIKKKIGALYKPDKRQGDNAYHLLGFETEETKADWVKRWKAAVAADDNAAMSALWTDKLVIQDIALGGDTDIQYSLNLVAGSNQSSITSTDGNLKLKLRFTSVASIAYDPVTKETRDTGESATLKIEKSEYTKDKWTEVTTITIPSISSSDTDSFTEIDLSNVLPDGIWKIRCTATGQNTEMTTPAVVFNLVTKTKLELKSAIQWWTPYTTSAIMLSYYINGAAVVKNLCYEITDTNGTVETKGMIPIGTSVYTESPLNVTVSGLAHGVHNVKAWVKVKRPMVTSDIINTQIIVATDSDDRDTLVAVNDVAKSVTNFTDAHIFNIAVYAPDSGSNTICPLKIHITDKNNKEIYSDLSDDYRLNTKEECQDLLEIDSQNKNIDAYIHIYDNDNYELIKPIEFNVDNTENFAPNADADFILNPKLRKNNEDHPDTIINAANLDAVKATFNNFGFKSDGWVSDNDGNKCLRVPSGAEVNINYEPFSAFTNSGNNTASMTMEFDIATRNVVNEDAAVLKVCSYNTNNNNPLGFELKPLEACFMTANLQNKQDQNIMFQDETRTHIAVNIIHNLANSGINYIRIFINGIINREIQYSSSDSFLQNVDGTLTSQGIRIGAEGADIDIYGIRIYKRALSASQITQDYVASLPTFDEKVTFRDRNDILGDNNLIDYNKTSEKYNTILWTGTLPSYANKANTKGDINIHIIGDPAHSGEMKNVEIKGQDASKSYWKWDQQFSTSYKDEKGNEVKTDWIDEDGTSHGAVYQLEEGLPLATKLSWKLNWAASQQSHNIGSTKLFYDLWINLGNSNGIRQYKDAHRKYPYRNCRISAIQKPFMLFTRATENSEPIFYGLVTFGPDKTDTATFGYDKDVFPDMCVLEGSGNDRPLTEFRVPWMLDEVTYNENEGAYQYNGENQFNLNIGNKNSVEKYFVPAFNVVFLHNLNIAYFKGTYEELVASKDIDKMKQYWVTADSADGSHHKYDLFRWDYITNTWVNASVAKTNNVYDVLNLETQAHLNISESTLSGNWAAINNAFISFRRNDFKSSVSDYFELDDFMYCIQFLKLIGASDNRDKNACLYVDPVSHKISLMQNDMDAVLNTDSVGRNSKPYYVENHDFDDSDNPYLNGSNNVLYNTIELLYSDELKPVMNSILEMLFYFSGSKGIFDCMEKYYFSVQKYFPAVAYNETARLLYEDAAVHYYKDHSYVSSINPLAQSLGDQLQAEAAWWKRREVYMSSYAKYSNMFNITYDFSGTKGYTEIGDLKFKTITDTDGNKPNYQFTVVPSQWLYPSFANNNVEYDNGTRVKAGDSFISFPIAVNDNTYISIKNIDYFKSIGKFGDKPVTGNFIIRSNNLIEFDASTPKNKKQQFRPSQITLITPLLSNLNLEGVSTIFGSMDLSNLTKLKTINLKGTNITSVKIPQSTTVETIILPEYITDLELAEVPNLSTFPFRPTYMLKRIIIGDNVGSGLDIVSILARCSLYHIRVNKLVIHNINITKFPSSVDGRDEIDRWVVEYIADIPEVSITGSIKVAWGLRLDTVLKLNNKFGNINNKNNSLYIDYIKYNITGVTLTGRQYFDKVGTYKLGYKITPDGGNNVINMVWSINDNSHATIDASTGEITVNSIGSKEDNTNITVTLTINLINGSSVTASKVVYLYEDPVKLGDIIFADGTYSNELDPSKTPIGVCFYKSDDLRLMCGLSNLESQPWGLSNFQSDGIPNIILASGNNAYYVFNSDTDDDVWPYSGIEEDEDGDYKITENTYVDTDGKFKNIRDSDAVGTLGNTKLRVSNDYYNKYYSYFNALGYEYDDYIPYGLINTITIIEHRDTILKDSNVNLKVPKATDGKSEATVLNELLTKISADKGGARYKQYYYPAASECYAYQPSVKDGEVLLDKFKAHHWWLPSEGELARMYYYHSHGYDTTKNDVKAIFAKASSLGVLKKFDNSVFWSSCEHDRNRNTAWALNFMDGDVFEDSGNEKNFRANVRPICAF